MSIVPIVAAMAYGGITFYNKMVSTIDAVESSTYSHDIQNIHTELKTLDVLVEAMRQRQLQGLETNVKLQEKTSDAIALSRETSVIAKGTQREVESVLRSYKNETEEKLRALHEKVDTMIINVDRSEEHTSKLQSQTTHTYAVLCLKKTKT